MTDTITIDTTTNLRSLAGEDLVRAAKVKAQAGTLTAAQAKEIRNAAKLVGQARVDNGSKSRFAFEAAGLPDPRAKEKAEARAKQFAKGIARLLEEEPTAE